MRGLEITQVRMTQVRAVEAVGLRPHGRGAPADGTEAGAESASNMPAVPVSAVRATAGQVTAKQSRVRPEPVTKRTVATGPGPDSRRQARPAPVRLTRRGRGVVAGLVLALTAAVVVLIWLAAAGGATAADRGLPARAAYQGLAQVVVRPGQTLWSIAAAAEPSADPRVVIQQIIETNALSGATIHAGQLLWVPKG